MTAKPIGGVLVDLFDYIETDEYKERCAEIDRIERERLEREIEITNRQFKRPNPADELERRGVPRREIAKLVEGSLEETRALEIVKRFLDSEEYWIAILAGPKGCGKTLAACYAVQQLGGHFFDMARFQCLDRYKESDIERIESLRLMVIDDVGTEYSDRTGAFRSLFDCTINIRYNAQRKTIITTNLDSKKFLKRYGERVADRIAEVGHFCTIAAAESMRQRGKP